MTARELGSRRVLDLGYLKTVEFYGSDESIIEAARMSTRKGFLGWDPGKCPSCLGTGTEIDDDELGTGLKCLACGGKGDHPGDAKLLRFLYTKKHMTPFEMAGAIVEVKAPIMVFREWHRHRTQSFNEVSARYIALPNENYTPTVERLMINAGTTNKQAGTIAGAEVLTLDRALEWLAQLAEVYAHCERVYQQGLQWGVPKELARLPVPVARYSAMRANANLRNWLGFLTLRAAPDAQWEIREYANVLAEILTNAFPRTLALWDEGRKAA